MQYLCPNIRYRLGADRFQLVEHSGSGDGTTVSETTSIDSWDALGNSFIRFARVLKRLAIFDAMRDYQFTSSNGK